MAKNQAPAPTTPAPGAPDAPDALHPEALGPDAPGAPDTSAPAATAEQPPAPALDFSHLLGKKAWVKTVFGDMTNLLTSQVFTAAPKKAPIDQFMVNQLEAGKMVLHVDTDE